MTWFMINFVSGIFFTSFRLLFILRSLASIPVSLHTYKAQSRAMYSSFIADPWLHSLEVCQMRTIFEIVGAGFGMVYSVKHFKSESLTCSTWLVVPKSNRARLVKFLVYEVALIAQRNILSNHIRISENQYFRTMVSGSNENRCSWS